MTEYRFGPPAFPTFEENFDGAEKIYSETFPGLSKREYAAIAILSAFMAHEGPGPSKWIKDRSTVEVAVHMADLLLSTLAAAAGEQEGDRPPAADSSEADDEPEQEEFSVPVPGDPDFDDFPL